MNNDRNAAERWLKKVQKCFDSIPLGLSATVSFGTVSVDVDGEELSIHFNANVFPKTEDL